MPYHDAPGTAVQEAVAVDVAIDDTTSPIGVDQQ